MMGSRLFALGCWLLLAAIDAFAEVPPVTPPVAEEPSRAPSSDSLSLSSSSLSGVALELSA